MTGRDSVAEQVGAQFVKRTRTFVDGLAEIWLWREQQESAVPLLPSFLPLAHWSAWEVPSRCSSVGRRQRSRSCQIPMLLLTCCPYSYSSYDKVSKQTFAWCQNLTIYTPGAGTISSTVSPGPDYLKCYRTIWVRLAWIRIFGLKLQEQARR